VRLGGSLSAILGSFGHFTDGLRWGRRVGIIPGASTIDLDLFRERRLRSTRSGRDRGQRPIVKRVRKNGGGLSLELCDIGNSGQGDFILFPHVLRSICFFILGLFHDGL
jgi:hypothetical protein